MQEGQFATGAVGLALQNTLTHVCPIVEDGPPGALDPTVMWRHEDLVQEWLQVVVGLHSYKSTIAAVGVAHDKVIDLQQFLPSGRIMYLLDLLFYQGRTRSDSDSTVRCLWPLKRHSHRFISQMDQGDAGLHGSDVEEGVVRLPHWEHSTFRCHFADGI